MESSLRPLFPHPDWAGVGGHTQVEGLLCAGGLHCQTSLNLPAAQGGHIMVPALLGNLLQSTQLGWGQPALEPGELGLGGSVCPWAGLWTLHP